MTETTTTYDIRLVTPEEYADTGIGQYAFGATPQPPAQNDGDRGERYLASSRLFLSYQDGAPTAKANINAMTLNVRGRVLPMGGVGGVSSMPAGRRKGHIRALMTTSFAQMREDGQPVSTLYPFRESFYERLGYAGWIRPRYTTLDPANLLPLLRMETPGTVEHMLIADGFDTWVDFLRAYQAETHGFAIHDETHLARTRDDNRWWLVLVREDGQVTGAMTYRITGYTQALIAHTFYSRTVAARYQLLGWIGRHADQVKEARVRIPADVYPETWFRDLIAPTSTNDEHEWPAPMGRIIDLAALSGIGAGDGEATIEVVDEHCPWNAGVWTLRGAGGVLEVAPGGTPTATLTIQGLGALLFAGADPATFPYRGWGDPDAATTAQLRALFPPVVPFLHEEF